MKKSYAQHSDIILFFMLWFIYLLCRFETAIKHNIVGFANLAMAVGEVMRVLFDANSTIRVFVQAVIVVFVIAVCFAFAHATPLGYEDAKVELTRLADDKKRSEYRHNWIKLSDEFYEIYRNNAKWNNRAAALFRSAYALDQMAQRSFVRKDAQHAIDRYLFLVEKHKLSPLADDALFYAAKLADSVLRDTKKAKKLLKQCIRDYPTGDFFIKAKKYYAEIGDGALASLGNVAVSHHTPSITLTTIKSQLNDKVVRIILSMETIASWRAKYKSDDKNPGVVVTLKDVAPSDNLDLEDTFKKNGIFIGYQIDYNETQGISTVTLEFSDLLRYAVKSEKDPARLIIEATASPRHLPAGIKVKDDDAKPKKEQKKPVVQAKKSSERPVRVQKDFPHITEKIAAQLGLKVETIVIDPGHGGKDPGAINNGVKEKNFNLDIAKRLGAVLKAAGYTVYYTRTTDKYVGLYERTDIARKYNADLFISLHANSSVNANAEGFETYFLDFSNDEKSIRLAAIENAGVEKRGLGEMEKILGDMLLKARIQESKRLAAKVQSNAVRKIKNQGYSLKSNGTKGAPFHVLIGSSMPCILIEMGYTSNTKEAKRLTSEKYKNALAEGIANGIHQYASELNKK